MPSKSKERNLIGVLHIFVWHLAVYIVTAEWWQCSETTGNSILQTDFPFNFPSPPPKRLQKVFESFGISWAEYWNCVNQRLICTHHNVTEMSQQALQLLLWQSSWCFDLCCPHWSMAKLFLMLSVLFSFSLSIWD